MSADFRLFSPSRSALRQLMQCFAAPGLAPSPEVFGFAKSGGRAACRELKRVPALSVLHRRGLGHETNARLELGEFRPRLAYNAGRELGVLVSRTAL